MSTADTDALVLIAAVENAYAAAIDRRDWPALQRCFTEDATITFGRPATRGSRAEFLAWAPRFHNSLGPTLHQVSTHTATVTGPAATARCHLHAVLVDPDGGGALSVFGWYDDELVRTDGEWRIRVRDFHPVWRSRLPPLG